MSTSATFTVNRLNTFSHFTELPEAGRLEEASSRSLDVNTRPIPVDAVYNRLIAEVRFSAASRSRSSEALLDAYQAGVTRVDNWTRQSQEFLHEMFDGAVEYSGFDSATTGRAIRTGTPPNQLALQVAADLIAEYRELPLSSTISPLVRLELFTLNREELFHSLRQDLELRISRFVSALFSHFHTMANRGVVGAAEFVGPNDCFCRFTYFHSRVICRRDSLKSRILRQSQGTPYFARRSGESAPRWWRDRRQTIELLESGSITVQHVSTQVVLSRAKTTPIQRWWFPLPERVVALLDAMPNFLKEHTAITTGTRRHAIAIERDVKQMPWTYSSEETRVETEQHVRRQLERTSRCLNRKCYRVSGGYAIKK